MRDRADALFDTDRIHDAPTSRNHACPCARTVLPTLERRRPTRVYLFLFHMGTTPEHQQNKNKSNKSSMLKHTQAALFDGEGMGDAVEFAVDGRARLRVDEDARRWKCV